MERCTARLWLRPIESADLDALHTIFVTPEVRRFLFDDVVLPPERTRELVEESVRRMGDDGTGLWGVRTASDGPLVGFAGFWPFHDQIELLYSLAPSHFGQGFATEVAADMLRYGFESLEMETIVGSTDEPHAASMRVMERVGMRHTKTRTIEGLPTVFFEVTRAEWEACRRSRSTPT